MTTNKFAASSVSIDIVVAIAYYLYKNIFKQEYIYMYRFYEIHGWKSFSFWAPRFSMFPIGWFAGFSDVPLQKMIAISIYL